MPCERRNQTDKHGTATIAAAAAASAATTTAIHANYSIDEWNRKFCCRLAFCPPSFALVDNKHTNSEATTTTKPRNFFASWKPIFMFAFSLEFEKETATIGRRRKNWIILRAYALRMRVILSLSLSVCVVCVFAKPTFVPPSLPPLLLFYSYFTTKLPMRKTEGERKRKAAVFIHFCIIVITFCDCIEENLFK